MPTRSTRFEPDPLDHALVDFHENNTFKPTAVALIINESFTGCSLLIKTTETVRDNHVIRVKVGRIDPLKAKIVWAKAVEEGIIKVGIQFLE